MKNIKFIPLFLIAFSMIISSCAIDDDDAIIPTGTTITASLDKTGEIFVFGDGDIDLGFVLSRPLGISTQFSYTLNGVEQSVVLDAGDQTVNVSIPAAVGSTNTVVLTEASALNNDAVSVGSTNTSVTFITVPAPIPGNIVLSHSLNDPSGQFFFTFAGFNADNSWAGDVYGGVNTSFNVPITSGLFNSADILPQYFALSMFTGALNDPGWTIYVVRPDSTVEIFSGNNLPLGGGVDAPYVLVDVTDAATPGDKSFIFTQN